MATPDSLPVLYSFRRCPYTMRARMAITKSGIAVELREVVLRDKPQSLIDASPKATVPTLVLPDETVIDESLDIMLWALRQNDPDEWLQNDGEAKKLIAHNDGEFKKALDRFKYPNRYPDEDCSYAQGAVQKTFEELNARLQKTPYLCADVITLADIAIFPFIRQASKVDEAWFRDLGLDSLYKWLDTLLESDLFKSVMKKYKPWTPDANTNHFPV